MLFSKLVVIFPDFALRISYDTLSIFLFMFTNFLAHRRNAFIMGSNVGHSIIKNAGQNTVKYAKHWTKYMNYAKLGNK